VWDAIWKHGAAAFGATVGTAAIAHAERAGRRAAAGYDENYAVRIAAEQMRDDANAILANLPRKQRLMPWAEAAIAEGASKVHDAAQALRYSDSRGLVPKGRQQRFGVRQALHQGRRNAPTVKERRKMGARDMALPWREASATYRRAHPELQGVGGYPMDTIKRARAARSYAVAQLNKGNLTQADVRIIFGRTAHRWGLDPLEGLACNKRGKKRSCRSVT